MAYSINALAKSEKRVKAATLAIRVSSAIIPSGGTPQYVVSGTQIFKNWRKGKGSQYNGAIRAVAATAKKVIGYRNFEQMMTDSKCEWPR